MNQVILDRILLYQFKNYEELELHFSKTMNCFIGENGSGKTNVLDAIHYLCTTRSYFQAVDSACIRFDAQQSSITGDFLREDSEEHIVIALRRNQKKVVKRNFKEYDRLADHIGKFPCVMITPYDIELIWEGSEVRRKFLDTTLSQCSSEYLTAWGGYQRALQQRNALLKSEGGKVCTPADAEPWDMQLVFFGEKIFRLRKEFVEAFKANLLSVYQQISGGLEQIDLEYTSDVADIDYTTLLRQNWERDIYLERTSKGVHRDELQFSIHGQPLKRFASQGQQKSFLIALKLTQYLYMREQLGLKPILMLDDLFEKIDEQRLGRILAWLKEQEMGQMFITDTHSDRIPALLKQQGFSPRIWKMEQGRSASIT